MVRLLSAEPAQVIGALAYLTNTVRSQRFSRSQRFTPTRTLRLCFAPHPPLGFRSSKLSSAQVSRSISRCPLLSCRWTSTRPKVISTKRPYLPHRLPVRLVLAARIPCRYPATSLSSNIISVLGEQARLLHRERSYPNQAWCRVSAQAMASTTKRSGGNASSKRGTRLQSLAPTERPYLVSGF